MELTPILRARRDTMAEAFEYLSEEHYDLAEKYVDKFIDYLEEYEDSLRGGKIPSEDQ